MMIEYKLIDGGYEIYVNGAKTIYQPHSPTRGLDVLLTKEEAERLAKLICKKLELGDSAVINSSEEAELLANVADKRIQEIAEHSLLEHSRGNGESQSTITGLEKEVRDLKEMIGQLLTDKAENLT